MERVVTCPCCFDDDHCFEEIVNESMSSWICFKCGMTTNSLFTEENKQTYVDNSPELIRELEFFDEERKLYWFPTVINMGPMGVVYPEGTKELWHWKLATLVDIPEMLQKQYPVDGKEGEYHTSRLDVENAKIFNQYEFLDAVREMGIVKDL